MIAVGWWVMMSKVRFEKIENQIPSGPGLYEIHTDTGIALKVGIGVSLRKRLLKHQASRQSCLRLKSGGDRRNPDDVVSKGSILAKHLYYDQSITRMYDLQSEAGRRSFLFEKCHIIFRTTETKQAARELEKIRECGGAFRYVGRVTVR
jgi:hypothetical protein